MTRRQTAIEAERLITETRPDWSSQDVPLTQEFTDSESSNESEVHVISSSESEHESDSVDRVEQQQQQTIDISEIGSGNTIDLSHGMTLTFNRICSLQLNRCVEATIPVPSSSSANANVDDHDDDELIQSQQSVIGPSSGVDDGQVNQSHADDNMMDNNDVAEQQPVLEEQPPPTDNDNGM